MKHRMLAALTAVGMLAGVVAGPAFASAGGVGRYQVETTSYTVAVLDTYIHTFVVTTNPCDGTIAISGSTAVDSGYYTTETVTGTLAGGVISFSSTYDGPYSPGFTWSGSFPVGGGALSGLYTGTVTAAPSTFSSYKNHGDFVSWMGGGPEAAHSCIGKPTMSGAGSAAAGATAEDSDNGPDAATRDARLIATLDAVLAKVSNPHAKAAIQRHVDAIAAGGSASNRGSHGTSGAAHPTTGQGHTNNGNHPDKP
jgi:hypothetical protein